MDNDSTDENSTVLGLPRYRSPTFSKEEVKVLLGLIEQYKATILNRSYSTAACHAKEVTWEKIAKIFNTRCHKHERSVECLRGKWFNLKKTVKNLSKNILDDEHNELDEVRSQIATMIFEAENNTSLTGQNQMKDSFNDSNDVGEQMEDDSKNNIIEPDEDKNNDSDENDGGNSRIVNRSMNFTPEESSLLIQCVRQERKIIFSNSNTFDMNKLKIIAWNRISRAFNKLSPRKRSTKVLRTKFNNMKRMRGSLNIKNRITEIDKEHKEIDNKHENLQEETNFKIKEESPFECKGNQETETDEVCVEDDRSDLQDKTHDNFNFIPDPLSTVLNSDSGIDIIDSADHRETARLKKELLNYKLGNAKLERKRIENAMQVEAIENSLRLRVARLNAVSAAMKLPPSHPALAFTAEEAQAQQYLQYNHT